MTTIAQVNSDSLSHHKSYNVSTGQHKSRPIPIVTTAQNKLSDLVKVQLQTIPNGYLLPLSCKEKKISSSPSSSSAPSSSFQPFSGSSYLQESNSAPPTSAFQKTVQSTPSSSASSQDLNSAPPTSAFQQPGQGSKTIFKDTSPRYPISYPGIHTSPQQPHSAIAIVKPSSGKAPTSQDSTFTINWPPSWALQRSVQKTSKEISSRHRSSSGTHTSSPQLPHSSVVVTNKSPAKQPSTTSSFNEPYPHFFLPLQKQTSSYKSPSITLAPSVLSTKVESKPRILLDSIQEISSTENARVYKAKRLVYSQNGTSFSREVVLKVNRNDPNQKEARNIIELHEKEVPNIVDLIETINGASLKHPSFLDFETVMVFPYEGEELYNFAKRNTHNFGCVLDITKQLLEHLSALGVLKVAHGDFTSKNIVIKDNKIKVIDWSNLISVLTPTLDRLSALWWTAPEAFLKRPFIPDDMFSLGCTLYQLVVGRTLFPSNWFPLKDNPEAVDKLHMKWIVSRLGCPGESYLAKSQRGHLFFEKEGSTIKFKGELFKDLGSWKANVKNALLEKGANETQAAEYVSFMEKLLCYENRISAEKALKLSLFANNPPPSLNTF